ncbi:MAG: hypothetical protein Ct9H300mP27_00910 [Chloroflexota bacterium]|nr:MAG: hypothetical protein Ct9H300mP27_00910 [Chloroflexota bacterium]
MGEYGSTLRPLHDSQNELVYVGELGVAIGPNSQALGVGPRVSIYGTDGVLKGPLGNEPGKEKSRVVSLLRTEFVLILTVIYMSERSHGPILGVD